MSDPIKKALEVAAIAICPMQGCSGYTPACGDCNPQAAAAIAAFLRALPKDVIPGQWLMDVPTGAEIAAAVERAAGGGA